MDELVSIRVHNNNKGVRFLVPGTWYLDPIWPVQSLERKVLLIFMNSIEMAACDALSCPLNKEKKTGLGGPDG